MDPSPKFLLTPKKNVEHKKKKWTPPQIFFPEPLKKNFNRQKKRVSVLLSASVKKFSVSRMRIFFFYKIDCI